MGDIRKPQREFVRVIEDSRRWQRFAHRPDDIFISTPPKSGTTWMQGIVSSLLWPAGDAPGDLSDRSPWVDARFGEVDELHAALAAQTHRRFIKTHSPADCVPIFEQCKYIVVYRDGRDALLSWSNHRAKMRPFVMEFLNESAAADGLEPMSPTWNGDMDELFDEWAENCSPITHLASWWPMRHEPFVHFVHYNDLSADLLGEMRRLAEFLEIDVPSSLWPEVVDRCLLHNMRSEAAASDRVGLAFEGGADAFFNQGINGRWRATFTADQLERYDQLVAEGLPDDAARWLEHGSQTSSQN